MPSGKGITISVTAETDAGKRRHMEDYLDVRLAPNETLKKIPALREQAFVGVFDGHGGKEAALYARERLWDLIQEQDKFRTTDQQKVMEAIQDAYWRLHKEMEPMRRRWKPNKLGDLSTAGTTACTVIFRQDHFYVANVGDSSAVLATVNQKAGEEGQPALLATMISKDHKPDDPVETKRVESLGGQVKVSRKGVPRVVWERKKTTDTPDQTTTVDLIPFLSVSRSLGDFWSWSERTQQFVVSPHPDVCVHPLDASNQKFIVLASDGLWNVMSPQEVVDFVWEYETREEEEELLHQTRDVVRALIDEALYRWCKKGMFADNISVVIAFFSQDGVPTLGGSSLGSSSQPVENDSAGHLNNVSTGVGRGEPVTVHHVHTTHSGSTLYHKEVLDGETLVEEHTVISLRCRRKDKQRAKEEERKRQQSLLHDREGGEGSKRSPGKRQREGTSEEELNMISPPFKKNRHDRDSGCESDGEGVSPTVGVMDPLSVRVEEPSSGVFSEDSCNDGDTAGSSALLDSRERAPSPPSPSLLPVSSDCAPVPV